MKNTFFLIGFIALFTMCKSKDIPSSEPIAFVVLLSKDASPKELKKTLNHTIVDFKPTSRSENQWRINFENQGQESEKIRRDLLNHNLVMMIIDPEKDGNMNSKNSKKAKISPVVGKKLEKQ